MPAYRLATHCRSALQASSTTWPAPILAMATTLPLLSSLQPVAAGRPCPVGVLHLLHSWRLT